MDEIDKMNEIYFLRTKICDTIKSLLSIRNKGKKDNVSKKFVFDRNWIVPDIYAPMESLNHWNCNKALYLADVISVSLSSGGDLSFVLETWEGEQFTIEQVEILHNVDLMKVLDALVRNIVEHVEAQNDK